MYYGIYPGFTKQQSLPDVKKNPCDYRMSVNGKGRITAVPDMASVILGVVTEGSELKTIQQENAARMSQIIAALKRMGISEKDIQTNSYFINMIYDYIDNRQVFKGYRVTNSVKVNIRDIQKTGEIVDAAVSNGANLVENIEFALSDPSSYYRKALSMAVKDAAENAKVIGKTLGVISDETPVSVTEETNSYIPTAVKSSAAVYDAATPIKPGLIDIAANIKAVFRYRDR